MYCKFRITCKACKCAMEIATNHEQLPGDLICQNCGHAMDTSARNKFFTALSALSRLPEETTDCRGYISDNEGFLINIVPEND